jgi:1-acyl-sn-glycerol-3-phosphate acyltransferase
MPVQAFALLLDRPLSSRLPLAYHRGCCRILGVEVRTHGARSEARPTLFVSNHVSYLDIPVLASLFPASFVAKADVAAWPLFGILARLQRTVFVDRRGSKIVEHRDQIVRRLEAGHDLILFPEGTSDDGNTVLPFKSALFSVAQHEIGGKALTVQPVSIAYTRIDGMPMGRSLRPFYAWYGDMTLLNHMWNLIGIGVVTVEVTFHRPVNMAEYGSRRALADHCFDVVARGVAAANAGRSDERTAEATART